MRLLWRAWCWLVGHDMERFTINFPECKIAEWNTTMPAQSWLANYCRRCGWNPNAL